MYLLMIVTCN